MEEKKTYTNIYQKLLVIQQRVVGLGKDKKSFGYDYVTGGKVLEHIKPIMNELGLLLKQEILSIENTRQDYETKNGHKSEMHTKAMMRFTWIDSETGEKDESLFGANGQNDWEKGLGSCASYGERYFLLKFFHIATDEDDIDNPDRKTSEPIVKKVADPAPQKLAAEPVRTPAATHEAGKITPNPASLPVMTEAQFSKAIQRINEGDTELFPKLRAAFQISVKNYSLLNEAHEFSVRLKMPAPPTENAIATPVQEGSVAETKTTTRKRTTKKE